MSRGAGRQPGRQPGRQQGRRAEVRTTSNGRTALLAVMLVGLTIGMLTLAGTTPRGIGRPVEDPSQVVLDQRVFSCPGGFDGTRVRSGTSADGLAAERAVTGAPARLVVDRELAQDAFAGQQVVTRRALGWLPCPEPRARWWFVAAGSAAVTHDTVLTLTNTRAGAAVVDVDVFGPKGQVESPGLHGLTIGAGQTRTIDLGRTAPTLGDLAVRVIARRGLVAASAADRFSPSGIGKEAVEWLPPQSLPSRATTLAGIPEKVAAATLVVVNPGKVDAIVTAQVIGATGTFEPAGLTEFTVAPDSVLSVPVTAVVDGTPMAVRLSSTVDVTGTIRSVDGGDTAFATGVRSLGGITSVAVPDGAGRLVLSSVGAGATVRVVVYDAKGTHLLEKTVAVGRRTSQAVPLVSGSRYVRLITDKPDVVAGFAVVGSTGIASAGVVPAIRSVRLPKVQLGW